MPDTLVPPPGNRSAAADIEAEAKLLAAVPSLTRILNAVPGMAMVVNANRQALLVNQQLLQFAGAAASEELLGLRPGEIFTCVNAADEGPGCGETDACSVCGSLRAIASAQIGRGQTQSCRFRRCTDLGEEALELTISTAPIAIDGRAFTLYFAYPAGDRARRLWFENALVPQALALAAETEVLAATLAAPGADPASLAQTAALLVSASRRLTELLREPLEMAELEASGSVAAHQPVSALELLSTAAGELRFHEAAQERDLRLDPDCADFTLETDRTLACRVIVKMLLNALEAVPPGEAVTLGCRSGDGLAELWVRNPGVIDRTVRHSIFQRSFSTKGPGRGNGAYTMKLIAERRLGGSVVFRSSAEEGTVFALRVPLVAGERAQ